MMLVMDPGPLALVSIGIAYLSGSIPFAYLVGKGVKGIDIRTVGSGNVGATNVGRELGFRYFLLVLALDALKGFLPTWGLPLLVGRIARAGGAPVDLPVELALAAIVGHMFPVFLRFRGGKGVATSLGAVLALDPLASLVAVLVFVVAMAATRYVSLASLLGALAFTIDRLGWVGSPLAREHRAMTCFTVGVFVLMLVRHRGNLARIWSGTERRVALKTRRGTEPKEPDRSGRVAAWVVIGAAAGLALVVAGVMIHRQATGVPATTAGPWRVRQVDRVSTGLQRVDRVAFDASGRRLAATCPRYERVLIYGVDDVGRLALEREVELEGRPLAVAAWGDGFVVLVQPGGDRRHVEPGWWELFDGAGHRVGGRRPTGYYPRDLAVSRDGSRLLVLCAGRSAGDAKKPRPSLEIVAKDAGSDAARVAGRVEWESELEPGGLVLSHDGSGALVVIPGVAASLAVDLTVLDAPRLIGRVSLAPGETPVPSRSEDGDWILLPVAANSQAIAVDLPEKGGPGSLESVHGDYVVCARERDSVLEISRSNPPLAPLGRLPLLGPFNMGRTRPTHLALDPARGLIAVATRSGAIHLIELSRNEPGPLARIAPQARQSRGSHSSGRSKSDSYAIGSPCPDGLDALP